MIDRRHVEPRRQLLDRRSDERRLDDRMLSEASVRFMRAATPQTVLHGELLDVSAAGVRILLELPLAPPEALLVEARDGEGRCCNMTARVVWTEALEAGGWLAGCEFPVELTPRQYATLRSLAGMPNETTNDG